MLPEAFLKRMENQLGAEYPEFLKSLERPRAVALRFNPLKGEIPQLPFVGEQVPWEPMGFYYDPASRPGLHPYHEAGVYYLQEASAMSAVALLDPKPGEKICETVVLLSKGEIDSKKVRVEFSLEDMDMSGFQKGATYEQIKAYVLEHTGLKVSSLYISQIKRKCGLDVGQNYNLSKKEDAKVPKCPPEKEAAIRDALKYFQMI